MGISILTLDRAERTEHEGATAAAESAGDDDTPFESAGSGPPRVAAGLPVSTAHQAWWYDELVSAVTPN